MAGDPPRYRFGPRSTRGLIAGWSGGQIAAVAIGAVVALGLMRTVGGIGGATLALLTAGVGAGVALWPVGGRPVESWVPTATRFVAAEIGDGRLSPWRPGRRHSRRGPIAKLAVRRHDSDDGGGFGIIEDEEAATWSAVMPVGGQGYALLDEAGRAAAVAAWSGVLTAMAGEGRGLHRLQWIARTYRPAARQVPTGAELPGRRLPAGAYAQLLSEIGPRLWDREVLVVVTTTAPRVSMSPKLRAAPEYEAAARLGDLLASLGQRLAGAGLVAGHPLPTGQLVAAIRRSHDLAPAQSHGPRAWPWPVGIEARWAVLRTDATWQATYWISEWPRGEVGPGVLLPLLLGASQRRCVSVTMAPLPPVRAVRRAERERTSGAADAELRRRHGFALTARARAEQELRMQREAELADGHVGYLFSGYVAVTAEDEATLERSCSEVEQAAALAQLELRRVYGAQEEAWCCTLPLGRGCR
ncbi:MAG: SCO6880 family protein [Acidimicrobiales bacterium]